MPNIRMVWLDYGRVLFDHLSDQLVEKIAAMSNPLKSPAVVTAMMYDAGVVKRYDLGAVTTDEFLEEMRALVGFRDRKEFIHAWHFALRPNLRMWQLVDMFRRNGYPQGVISNTNELHAMHIESLMSFVIVTFSPRIYSYLERVKKPDQEIWRRAIERANIAYGWEQPLLPQECVLIDDMDENVRSFQEFGGHAICHNPQFVHRTAAHLLDLGVQL